MSTIKERLPQEFKEEMKALLNEEYEDFINSYDEERTNAIRINTLKIDEDTFKKMNLFGIDFKNDKVPWADLGYYVEGECGPGKNPLHDAGAYYIQEPSAMSVVGRTDISEGEKILDMCAAPGGKSTYILSKLNETGILVSNEISNKRIRALGENLERFGATNCTITNSDSKGLLTFFKGFFDKVFIDAPCSGQGMFRKHEYAIDDWSEDKVEECVSIQKEIIRDGYRMLKDGGMLIYSTCTFTKKENEEIINDFINEHNDAQLLEMERIWPHIDKGEGHFCARIIKNPDGESDEELSCRKEKTQKKSKKGKKSSVDSKKKDTAKLKDYERFLEDFTVKDSRRGKIISAKELEQKGDFLYLVDREISGIKGVKVLRNGLLMGEIKKNRFEPSHSLAMALCIEDVKYAVNLDFEDEDVYRYISGESISLKDKEVYRYSEPDLSGDDSRGWILVTVDGVSIGWGKESNGILKNKYPKGLRRVIRK